MEKLEEMQWYVVRQEDATKAQPRLEVNEMRMLRWICRVTMRDKIQNQHIRDTTKMAQEPKKLTKKRLKWYDHVMGMKEEHIVRRMLFVDIPGKRSRRQQNLRRKVRVI